MSERRPTLVILAPYSGALWGGMLARLQSPIDVIVDELGGGDSLEVLATRVAERVPAQFALMGLCMGGHVALELLRAMPDRVSHLALISTGLRADSAAQAAIRADRVTKLRSKSCVMAYPDDSYLEKAVPWLLSAASFNVPHVARAVRDLLSAIPLSRSADQQKAMLDRVDNRALLSGITLPTLVVNGRDDRVVQPLQACEIGEVISNSRVHILDQCGHLAPIEVPAELAALVSQWLRAN